MLYKIQHVLILEETNNPNVYQWKNVKLLLAKKVIFSSEYDLSKTNRYNIGRLKFKCQLKYNTISII